MTAPAGAGLPSGLEQAFQLTTPLAFRFIFRSWLWALARRLPPCSSAGRSHSTQWGEGEGGVRCLAADCSHI